MKKYGLITLLSLSFISHATSQTISEADEYYKNALESTQKLNAKKSSTAETVYESTIKTAEEIKQISNKLKSQENPKSEELQALQIELSLLQANLQKDALRLQSLAMIQAKDTKTKDEIREEDVQKKHLEIAEKLKEQLEKSDVRL
ncbi:type IV secretion system protein [Bartonella heixiaziensis]|uniref:type IV secretion system protein n=1 Tax=Bartonella heixiaziensis TaxID=1461000 RepID=UPI003908B180